MAQWKNTDNAANSVSWVAKSLGIGSGKVAQAANNTTIFNNTTVGAFIPGKAVGQFGVSIAEAEASRAAHAGWVLRTEGSGNRAGRVTFEVLVAGSMITGDADADVIPLYSLSFDTQPSNKTTPAATPTSFPSLVVSKPAGASIAYQWQANSGGGFANVTNGAVYSNATTAVLYVGAPTGLNGVQYRVVATAANSAPVTSKTAVITVT